MDFTIDNAFNLRDLVLQELVKVIVVCYIKRLKIEIQMCSKISLKMAPTIGPKHVAVIIL